MKENTYYHAIYIDEELCTGCSHCVKVCPTQALHVWEGISHLNAKRCIDCDVCYQVCKANAIKIADDGLEQIKKFDTKVALIPSVFMGQFQHNTKALEVFSAVQELGFDYVYEVEESAQLLESIFADKITSNTGCPIVSSFCPVVTNLIKVYFPSLVDNIINIQTPVDITATSVRKRMIEKGKTDVGIFYITPCSAKITALKSSNNIEDVVLDGVINMDSFYNDVQVILNSKDEVEKRVERTISNNAVKSSHIMWSLSGGETKNLPGTCLSIDGVDNIMKFLDRIETQGCHEIDFLEMKSCDQGCAGGILTPQNRFLTAHRLRNRAKYYENFYKENKNKTPKNHTSHLVYADVETSKVEPRSIMKLDSNPMKALVMMQEIEEIRQKLPKLDCTVCGYKSCRSFAENIVRGNAKIDYCVFLNENKTREETMQILREVWGDKMMKFE